MGKKVPNGPIDVILPWVDAADSEWDKLRQQYSIKIEEVQKNSTSITRFESWDNLRYVFRGIEKCMPWINKVFFVTYGHLPSFLNPECPKLRIVNHKDYIPEKYLPTFNSNTIEINYHRIGELSENFILFNDDLFPIQPIKETYYFKNNCVCDEAVERALCPNIQELDSRVNMYRAVNIMILINKYFHKREVQKKNWWKWYYPFYGKRLMRTLSLSHYYDFDYFSIPHMAVAMKKSVIKKIWELEPEIMDASSRNKFRSYSDISQYIFRFWKLCEGDFYPRRTKGLYVNITDENCEKIADMIRGRKHQMIALNESGELRNFENVRSVINKALSEIYPEKSIFEK
jgi:hypothetical protein